MIKKFTAFLMALTLCISADSGNFRANAESYEAHDFTTIFEAGQHLKEGDYIHFVETSTLTTFSVLSLINGEESYHYAYRGYYKLPCDMVVAGVYEQFIYLIAETDIENCIDVQSLETGDIIDTEKYMLCYNWKVNGMSEGFFNDYSMIGDGTVEVFHIDSDNNAIYLRGSESIGDVNRDGDFNIADAVILEEWLMGKKLEHWQWGWQNADLNNDKVIDVFDLCAIKSALAEKYSDYSSMRFITRDEIIELAFEAESRELTWEDFADFGYKDISSDTYVYEYPIQGNDYELYDETKIQLSGASLSENPEYIEIMDNDEKMNFYEFAEIIRKLKS